MPRPTLERTLKYIPVVPRAQSKLGREARRGSHDLRKLVGHANFLDTLMEKLELDDADDGYVAEAEDTEPGSSSARFVADESGHIDWSKVDFDDDDQWETADSDSSDEDEDELVTPEFDHENDDGHALSRTHSHRDLVPAVEAPVRTLPIVTPAAQHPIAVAAAEVDSESEMSEVDQHIQEPVEDYFSDKHLPQKRAEVAVSLATFDMGKTLSTVSETA